MAEQNRRILERHFQIWRTVAHSEGWHLSLFAARRSYRSVNWQSTWIEPGRRLSAPGRVTREGVVRPRRQGVGAYYRMAVSIQDRPGLSPDARGASRADGP